VSKNYYNLSSHSQKVTVLLCETLQHKEGLISALDDKILESLINDDEVKAEVLQAEEINSLITIAKVKITHCLTSLAASISTHPHRTEFRERSDCGIHVTLNCRIINTASHHTCTSTCYNFKGLKATTLESTAISHLHIIQVKTIITTKIM